MTRQVYVIITFEDYSRVSNKCRPTFINFWRFFQGLRSYLGGLRLLILTKTFHENFWLESMEKMVNRTFFFQFSSINLVYPITLK